MAITDRRGVSVDATDTPIAGGPNPGLAIKAPARLATSGSNIVLAGLLVVDGIQTVAGDRVLVKDQTSQINNGLYNASSGNWTRTIDASSNDQLTRGMQVLVSEGATSANTIFQLTSANPVTLGTSLITFIRTSVPSTISTTAPLTGGGSVASNPTFALSINASLQVVAGALAVATLAGVAHKWVSSINASGVPQLTQPAFSDISGTIAAAQITALPTGVTLAGSILATNMAAPSTPASGKTSIYVDTTQKVLSAINDAGTVSITVVPATGGAGQFVTGIGANGVLAFGAGGGGGSGTVNSSTAGQLAYYPASSAAVSGNSNLSISGSALTLAAPGIGSSSTDGFVLANTTAAGAGAQQWSPRLHLIGQGWKTNATAGSQTVDWIVENQPVQGAANPTTNLVLSCQVNGAGYTAQATLTSGGVLNVATGFQVAGSANSGNVLRANGSAFIAATLAAADLSNGVTGSGAVVLATSPTLTTPTLGAATATTLNKVTITAPAASATLTIANAKTLTVSNTLTLAGTDATTMTFPAGSDTLGGLATAQTWTAQNIHAVASTIASATAAALDDLKVAAATTTITGNTGSPITRLAKVGLYRPTLTDASAVTVTDAATLYIDNSPLAAGSVTITNAWALLVGAGASKLQATTLAGALTYGGVTLANAVTGTGNMVLSASPTLSGTIAGALTFSGALTLSSALTYGGVTLANAVTGTGNMVLSASPTLSGTIGGALTFSGAHTLSAALTYGGVTLSNAVTGTGNMVLGTTPTISQPNLVGTTTNDNAAAGSVGEWKFTGNAGQTSTVTITNATPGVVSWTAHGLNIGDGLFLTTTGGLPTGLSPSTNYYVSSQGFGANSFSLSTTVDNALAGTSIATSSAGSGTHTALAQIILATATPANVLGMSLTAGDWMVAARVFFSIGATTVLSHPTLGSMSLSSAALNVTTLDTATSVPLPQTGSTGGGGYNALMSPTRFSLSGTTTIYLVAQSSFTTSTCQALGFLSARRVR